MISSQLYLTPKHIRHIVWEKSTKRGLNSSLRNSETLGKRVMPNWTWKSKENWRRETRNLLKTTTQEKTIDKFLQKLQESSNSSKWMIRNWWNQIRKRRYTTNIWPRKHNLRIKRKRPKISYNRRKRNSWPINTTCSSKWKRNRSKWFTTRWCIESTSS